MMNHWTGLSDIKPQKIIHIQKTYAAYNNINIKMLSKMAAKG